MSKLDDAKNYYKWGMENVKNNGEPKDQKFAIGSRVRIADYLGPHMGHFITGRDATVKYTYAHAFGGNDVQSYCLDIDGYGEASWYKEKHLTSI